MSFRAMGSNGRVDLRAAPLRVRRARALPVLAFLACAVACASTLWSEPASAQSATSLLTSIGRFLGAPFGGLLDAPSAPAIQNVQGAANQVIGNLDAKVDDAIKNAGTMANGTITHAQQAAGGLMTDANTIMTSRIAQVKMSGDELIDRATGSINLVEHTAFADANKLVATFDEDANKLVKNADAVIQKDLSQAQGVVDDAIGKADADVKARIEQVDEAASRQVGSVDAVATKQTYGVEGALLEVASFLGMIGFLAAGLLYLFKHIPARRQALANVKMSTAARRARIIGSSAGWVGLHLVAGAIGVFIFWVLAQRLPASAKTKADALTATHQTALSASLQGLDLTGVKYHAAILAVLAPDCGARGKALQLRAEIVRDVLTRPALLGTAAGIAEIEAQLDEARRAQDAVTQGTDAPDLLTVACHVRWQLARTRSDELDAVSLCGQALRVGRQTASASPAASDACDWTVKDVPLLAPLAAHYVTEFLARPMPWDKSASHPFDAAELKGLAEGVSGDPRLTDSATAYDAAVLALDTASTKAFLNLLTAQAEVQAAAPPAPKATAAPKAIAAPRAPPARAAVAKNDPPPPPNCSNDSVLTGKSPPTDALHTALLARCVAAGAVIDAWKTFDDALKTDARLAQGPIALAAFGLNDAPLSEALWYYYSPENAGAAPAVSTADTPWMRLNVLPIRVSWARRYLAPLRSGTQLLASYQESARFEQFEASTLSFASAYIAYQVAFKSKAPDFSARQGAAAIEAAQLGLYVDGVPLSTTLLGDGKSMAISDDQRKSVGDGLNRARLRLL